MKKYKKDEALKRLNADIECKKIFEKYLNRGILDEIEIVRLKHGLSLVPNEWECIKNESISAIKNRRRELALKFEELSSLVADDVDAKFIRIYEEGILTDGFGAFPSKQTLSSFLADLAEHIETLGTFPDREMFDACRPKKKARKFSEAVLYAARRVLLILDSINTTRQVPNKDAAAFVNVLFELSGDEKIKNNDIAHMPMPIKLRNEYIMK